MFFRSSAFIASAVSLSLLSVASLGSAWGDSFAVIFGADDRRDIDEVRDSQWLRWADSSVAFFDRTKLEPRDGKIAPRLEEFGPRFGICRDERYFHQGSGSDFSGVLIGPDLVLTAAHAMHGQADCDRFEIVFGFDRRNGEGSEFRALSPNEIYECDHVVSRVKGDGGDYAVIQLRRPVIGHRPLRLSRGPVAIGTPIVVIGHPNGLPTKVAGGANVRGNSDPSFLEVDTDTFDGNSGSPVLDARTGEIVGILVNGSVADFRDDPVHGCRRPTRCAQNECGSEILTRASVVRF